MYSIKNKIRRIKGIFSLNKIQNNNNSVLYPGNEIVVSQVSGRKVIYIFPESNVINST